MPSSIFDPKRDFIEQRLKRRASASSPHIVSAMFLESFPDILIIETPPLPGAVAGAIMVLFLFKADRAHQPEPTDPVPYLVPLEYHHC